MRGIFAVLSGHSSSTEVKSMGIGCAYSPKKKKKKIYGQGCEIDQTGVIESQADQRLPEKRKDRLVRSLKVLLRIHNCDGTVSNGLLGSKMQPF